MTPALQAGVRRRTDRGARRLHSGSEPQPAYGGLTDVEDTRQVSQQGAVRQAFTHLLLLLGAEGRSAPHRLAALLGPCAALCRPGADQVAFHVGEASEDGEHESAGAGAGIGPRLGEGAELRLRIHDPPNNGEQVEGGAGQAVNSRDQHLVAVPKSGEEAVQLSPICPGATDLLLEDARAPGGI